MTIATLALRLITVAALTGATRAGDAVGDSQLGASQRHDGLAIAVHVDRVAQVGGLPEASRQGDGEAHLIIELADLVRPDGGGGWASPPTDAVLEAHLDLLEREICAALLDGDGVWPDLWRRCVVGHVAYEMRRGDPNLANGVRFAGREIAMRLRVIAEPPLGAVPAGFWADFLAAASEDEALDPLVPDLVSAFAGAAAPSWRQARADLGIASDVLGGIGVAPPFETDIEAPLVAEIDLLGIHNLEVGE